MRQDASQNTRVKRQLGFQQTDGKSVDRKEVHLIQLFFSWKRRLCAFLFSENLKWLRFLDLDLQQWQDPCKKASIPGMTVHLIHMKGLSVAPFPSMCFSPKGVVCLSCQKGNFFAHQGCWGRVWLPCCRNPWDFPVLRPRPSAIKTKKNCEGWHRQYSSLDSCFVLHNI